MAEFVPVRIIAPAQPRVDGNRVQDLDGHEDHNGRTQSAVQIQQETDGPGRTEGTDDQVARDAGSKVPCFREVPHERRQELTRPGPVIKRERQMLQMTENGFTHVIFHARAELSAVIGSQEEKSEIQEVTAAQEQHPLKDLPPGRRSRIQLEHMPYPHGKDQLGQSSCHRNKEQQGHGTSVVLKI